MKARGNRRDVVERVQRDVDAAFAKNKLAMQVFGREKTLYSIYRKMREKHLSFAQVSDIFGFRIVVEELGQCYLALGVLHQLYKPIPGASRTTSRSQGQRLPVAAYHAGEPAGHGGGVPDPHRGEMHAVAESGIAAHWMYKGKNAKGGDSGQGPGGPAPGRDVAAVADGHPARDA